MANSDVSEPKRFLFVVCQNGAEAAARKEILAAHPELRLAFSRPGIVTFKVDPEKSFPEKFTLHSALTRTCGWSHSNIKGDDAVDMVNLCVGQLSLTDAKHLHVWQRDPIQPGRNGFEPGVSPLATEVGELFVKAIAGSTEIKPPVSSALPSPLPLNQIAKPDEKVVDVIMVEPNQWLLGYHFANSVPQRWPGGVPFMDTDQERISRAYYKAKEALVWSGIKIQPGDICAEIGSAPGGSCELLLEMGANVIGIDPAEMETEVMEHPNFTHIRRRGHEVKKKDLRHVRWMFADFNLVPNYTLDTITDIVGNSSVDVKGLILTMKMTDWKMVDEVSNLMKRVREMGFGVVKARQLAFNRREFCLVGVKDKFILRSGKRKSSKSKAQSKPESESKPNS